VWSSSALYDGPVLDSQAGLSSCESDQWMKPFDGLRKWLLVKSTEGFFHRRTYRLCLVFLFYFRIQRLCDFIDYAGKLVLTLMQEVFDDGFLCVVKKILDTIRFLGITCQQCSDNSFGPIQTPPGNIVGPLRAPIKGEVSVAASKGRSASPPD